MSLGSETLRGNLMRSLARISIAALTGAALVFSTGGATSTGEPAVAGHVSTAAVPVLATGKVVDTRVRTAQAASGAEVVAWWTPGLAGAKPGDELPIRVVATTRTAADGTYTLRAAPTAPMRKQAATADGWVNLNISVLSDTAERVSVTGISRRITDGGWETLGATDAQRIAAARNTSLAKVAAKTRPQFATANTSDDEAAKPAENRLPVTNVVLSADSMKTAPGAARATRQALSTAGDFTTSGVTYCKYKVINSVKRATRVVEFHSAANADSFWSYGKTSDSDIQGAINFGNVWAPHTTSHISNTAGTLARKHHKKAANLYGRIATRFNIGTFVPVDPRTGSTGDTCYHTGMIAGTTKTAHAAYWAGGFDQKAGKGSEFIGCKKNPQKQYRARIPRDSDMERISGHAATISTGVKFGVASLSTKSGYSEHVTLHWHTERGPIFLCGTYRDFPLAGVVHAQNA